MNKLGERVFALDKMSFIVFLIRILSFVDEMFSRKVALEDLTKYLPTS